MRSRLSAFLIVTCAAALAVACGGGAANNAGNSATNSANSSTSTKKEEAVTNEAPTLTPVVKAYCDAKIKNDEAGLRKVYSSDTIKSFEEQMKEDKITSLAKFLEDDKVSDKLCRAENETITGDSGIAKMYIDSYPNGIKVYFVKEGGEWKMTNRSPSFEAVKQSDAETSANSNAATKGK